MTKHCQCGKTKTIQPFSDSRSMKFTCDACKQRFNAVASPLEKVIKSELDKYFS